MTALMYIDYGGIVPSFKENVVLHYLKDSSIMCIHESSSEITGVREIQFMTYSRLFPIL